MNKKLKIFIFCLIVSCLTLLVTSKNSFLYPINDGVDMNAYFTVGKGLFHNTIPYKDLFDQKGPYIYLIYGLASLISSTSFIGVFMFEVGFFTVFLFYIYKILTILEKEKYVYWLVPLLALMTTVSDHFIHGGSLEEFCLPIFTYIFYLFIKYLKIQTLEKHEIIIVGLLSGILFFSKYNLLGPSIVFMLTILFSKILKKDYKSLFSACFEFMIGIFIAILPWIVYFLITKSLKSFIDVYFIINLTAYSNSVSLLRRLVNILDIFFSNFLQGGSVYLILFILSICWFKNFFMVKKLPVLPFYLLVFLTIFFIYIGNNSHLYYAVYLYPLLIGGILWIFEKVEMVTFPSLKKFISYLYCIYLIVLFVLLFKGANYLYLIGFDKKELMQYKFAEIINKEENATILEYGWLDSGLYFATGKIPNVRYFCQLNFDYDKYPTNHDEQMKYINERKIDFVLVTTPTNYFLTNDNLPEELKNYQIVSDAQQLYEGSILNYYLLEKIEKVNEI